MNNLLGKDLNLMTLVQERRPPAWFATSVMKGKQRLSMSCKVSAFTTSKVKIIEVASGQRMVSKLRTTLRKTKVQKVGDLRKMSIIALKATRKHFKDAGWKI